MLTKEEIKADLQKLRQIFRGSRGVKPLEEAGFDLRYRSRYSDAAEEVARIARKLGDRNAEVEKDGSVKLSLSRATRPYVVYFTLGIDADLYLAGRMTGAKALAAAVEELLENQ